MPKVVAPNNVKMTIRADDQDDGAAVVPRRVRLQAIRSSGRYGGTAGTVTGFQTIRQADRRSFPESYGDRVGRGRPLRKEAKRDCRATLTRSAEISAIHGR